MKYFEMNMEQGGVITRKLSLLKEGEQGGGAAIRISSSGETLYVSVRGINQLYVIDIAQWRILQRIPVAAIIRVTSICPHRGIICLRRTAAVAIWLPLKLIT